jgi:hypothetical protein
LPRDLGDVLHYFLPEAKSGGVGDRAAAARRRERETPPEGLIRLAAAPGHPAALPLVGIPIGDRDVVRAAFTWNLAVEVVRLGGRAVVVAPARDAGSPLWPVEGVGPMGAEVAITQARSPGELYRRALDLSVERAAEADDGGLVFVRLPPSWLRRASESGNLMRWMLLFTTAERRDLLETYGLAKLLLKANTPSMRVGVTIHGARRVRDAERAFSHLARVAEKNLGCGLTSYGLLVDDLDVYRAIVAQRPIGLEHPQCPAARALRDVARLVLDQARELAVD